MKFKKFYQLKDHKPSGLMSTEDYEEASGFLDMVLLGGKDSRFKVMMRSYMHEQWANCVSINSGVRALKRGFDLADYWLYVNPIGTKRVLKTTPKKTYSRQVKYINGQTYNFMVDIDNSPHFNTLDGLIEYFAERKIPLPTVAVQTSENGFHVLYTGNREVLSESFMTSVYLRIAGLDGIEYTDKAILREDLKRNGVDPHWLFTNRVEHRIRIPGTYNHKYIEKPFRCKSWINPKPHTATTISNASEVVFKRKENRFWNKYEKPIAALLESNGVSTKVAENLSIWLSQHVTFLKKGELSISQLMVSELIGISQQHLSRLLKELVKNGVLTITKPHIYSDGMSKEKRRPRVYAAGEKLMAILVPPKKVPARVYAHPSLLRPYETGNTFNQMSEDIRILYRYGFDVENIVDFCYDKQNESSWSRYGRDDRTKKEIWGMVENWDFKFDYTVDNRYPVPKIDLETVLNKVSYDQYERQKKNYAEYFSKEVFGDNISPSGHQYSEYPERQKRRSETGQESD